MKNIAVLYYDGFAEFEVVLTCSYFKSDNLISIALEKRDYKSMEGQKFVVDQVLAEVDVDSLDLLIIPGGNSYPLIGNQELKAFIEEVNAKDKKIAAICGGSELIATYGLLKGKRCTGDTTGVTPECHTWQYYADSTILDDYVVVDGNIITGQGQAYAEFSVEVANQMGLIKDAEEYKGDLNWVKNIRS